MFDRLELKNAAKSQIKGNIGTLFIAMLLMAVITSVASFVSWLIAPAFVISFAMIYLKLIDGQKPQVGNIFDGFSIFGKAFWLSIITSFFIMLWSLLLIVPGIMKTYAYMMAPYILAENPELKAREALNESKRITDGHKMNLFVLHLSFIGWGLLGIVTMGIAFIYVIPYIEATTANAYKKLKAENKQIAADSQA